MNKSREQLNIRPSKSKGHKQRGTAMVETIAALPLLLLLFGGVYDLGMLIHSHSRASRIAYEGARYAASLAGLPYQSETGEHSMHSRIQERLEQLMQSYGIDSTNANVEVFVYDDNGSPMVKSSISLPYEPILLRWVPEHIRVIVRSPYLYPTE
jgi:hypothetical protein